MIYAGGQMSSLPCDCLVEAKHSLPSRLELKAKMELHFYTEGRANDDDVLIAFDNARGGV